MGMSDEIERLQSELSHVRNLHQIAVKAAEFNQAELGRVRAENKLLWEVAKAAKYEDRGYGPISDALADLDAHERGRLK